MEFSTLITDETYVYEGDQNSQETEIQSIVATPSMSISGESVEFLAMGHHVSSGVSLLVGV